MSLVYIRTAYQVPAKRGRRIRYTGDTAPRTGTIVAAAGQYLRVRFDDEPKRIHSLHPTWKVEYLEETPDEQA
ncbi:hypothetical protein GS502_11175 [Rhodococcus hoagii]|nr:hypothetical protein [Prescottella equi]